MRCALALVVVGVLAGCASRGAVSGGALAAREGEVTPEQARNRANMERYLNARDVASAEACLAPGFRPRMLDWDANLRPRRTISAAVVNDDAAVAVIHEDNDFSRLIEHPGWDGTMTFLFAADGKITKTHFTPTPGKNPEWGPYMKPALAWLREHRAEELARAFPGEKLRQDAEGARMWREMLREWRRETGRQEIQ